MATELQFHPGDVVFREGDASGFVCRITHGEVDVVKATDGGEVVLGTVGADQFVGEMGVIEGRPRSATVRAVSEVRLDLLAEDEFLRMISRDEAAALSTIRRLSERLRAADDRVLAAEAATPVSGDASSKVEAESKEPVLVPTTSGLRLLPGSDVVSATLPEEGVLVEQLPFHVGRPPAPGEAPSSQPLALALPDARPFRLSRLHFSVVPLEGGAGYAVRDVGSTLGTIVNGEFIGQHAPKTSGALLPGENLVLAGGRDSAFIFRVALA